MLDEKKLDSVARNLYDLAKYYKVYYMGVDDIKQDIRLLAFKFPKKDIAIVIWGYKKDFVRKILRRIKLEKENYPILLSMYNDMPIDHNFKIIDQLYDEELRYKKGGN